MPYIISNPRTGVALTATLDRVRAQQLTYGFEQYVMRDDIGARNHYWYLGRLRLGQRHPYDEGARRILDAERGRLVDLYLAGR